MAPSNQKTFQEYENIASNRSNGLIGVPEDGDMARYHTCRHPLEWRGCYSRDAKYNKYVTSESFSHPAKFAWGLLERIFKHLQELELIKQETTIIDFMAGSNRAGVMAELFGYKSVAVELEPHFVDMIKGYHCEGRSVYEFYWKIPHPDVEGGHWTWRYRCGKRNSHPPHYVEGNSDRLKRRTGRKPAWEVIQGDARRLSEIIDMGGVGLVSPPYGDAEVGKGIRPNRWEKVKDRNGFKGRKDWRQGGTPSEYGKTEGQIGNLYDLPMVGVVSPPYAQDQHSRMTDKCSEMFKGRSYKEGEEYSSDFLNIGNLKDTPMAEIISPPYGHGAKGIDETAIESHEKRSDLSQGGPLGKSLRQPLGYSENYENIGNLRDVPLVGITSPPYQNIEVGKGLNTKPPRLGKNDQKGRNPLSPSQTRTKYSDAENNIGNLSDEPLVGVVSPPYSNRMDGGKEMAGMRPYTNDPVDTWFTERDPTNIGNLVDGTASRDGRESYLQAMNKVYSEAYKSGISPLCVVVKNPTRNGKLRRLDLDTITLLQSIGYEIFDYHRAILFDSHKQETLDGSTKDVHKGRIGFFKRLSLDKGNMAAQWEDIIFARIPAQKPR